VWMILAPAMWAVELAAAANRRGFFVRRYRRETSPDRKRNETRKPAQTEPVRAHLP
jgi:hypothetical protein